MSLGDVAINGADPFSQFIHNLNAVHYDRDYDDDTSDFEVLDDKNVPFWLMLALHQERNIPAMSGTIITHDEPISVSITSTEQPTPDITLFPELSSNLHHNPVDIRAVRSEVIQDYSKLEEFPATTQVVETRNLKQVVETRNLTKAERQKLQAEAMELQRQLLRIYSILDIETLILNCDLQKGQIIDRKATCGELLVAANEIAAIDKSQNPIKIASDIYNRKRTLFPRQEIPSKNAFSNGGFDPYCTLPHKHEVQRGKLLREVATMYSSLYRKSPSNQSLTIKEATLGEVETLICNYYKDGYKISPGMQQYMESPINRKNPLETPQLDPTQPKEIYPICWDTNNIPYCVKSLIYKCWDRRSSEEAAQRARNLTAKRKQLQAKKSEVEVKKGQQNNTESKHKRPRLLHSP